MYLVQSQKPIGGTTRLVLKRVAVREKPLLEEVRREVEVMVRCLEPPFSVQGRMMAHVRGNLVLSVLGGTGILAYEGCVAQETLCERWFGWPRRVVE